MTYTLCIKMLESALYTKEQLTEKFDTLYLMNRLEQWQYTDLVYRLNPPIEETPLEEVVETPIEETI